MNTNIKRFLLIGLLTITAYAKDLKVESSLITGKLDNGFEYTIKKNAKPVDNAEIRLLIKAGALEEDDDQKGIAHLVEHMAFNGSENFPGNSLITYLESIGVAFGSHLNASTGTTRTLYKLSVPLKNDNLDKSFLIFEDWAGGLNFDAKELDKERGVILEEARSRDNVGFRLYLQSKDVVYAGSKYKDRTPIGDLNIIRTIKVDRAKAFYTRWYRPELMHLVVVGDVDVEEVKELINKHFAHLKNTNHDKTESRSVPKVDELRVLTLSDDEVVGNSLSYYFFNDATKVRTEQEYKEALELSIALKMYNLENADQLTKDNPVLSKLKASSSKLGDNLQTLAFSATYDGDNKNTALTALASSIYLNEKYGFKQESFDAIKETLVNANKLAYKKIGNKDSASYAKKIISSVQNENVYIDETYQYHLLVKLLNDVSLEAVEARFKKLLQSRAQLIVFTSQKKSKLTKEEVAKVILNAKSKLEKPKAAKKLPSSILNKELKEGKIVSEIENKKYAVKGFELENGVKVLYKFNNYAKESVSLYAYSEGGFSLLDDKLLTNAKYAPSIVLNSGSKEYTKAELRKINAGKSAQLSPYISRYSEGFKGKSASKDFEKLLELVYVASKEFTLDDNILNNTKRTLSKKIQEQDATPKIKFSKEFKSFYMQNSPRYKSEDKRDVESLNSDDILKIYADRFSDANNFTYIIVGDIAYEEVKVLASKYLTNLPTLKRYEKLKDRKVKAINAPQTFVRFYEKQNISTITMQYEQETPYSLEKSIKLNALQEVLNIKLREYIREEKSGVYGVRVRAGISRKPYEKANVTISFTCDPKRRAELVASVKETLQAVQNKPVASSYIDAIRKKKLLGLEQSIITPSFWQERLKRYVVFGDNISDVDKYEKLYTNISAKNVQQTAKQYLKEENLIYSELNPK